MFPHAKDMAKLSVLALSITISHSLPNQPLSKLMLGNTDSLIPAGTAFVVVVKDECEKPGAITERIENRYLGKTKSGVRSYNWRVPQTISAKNLSSLANRDQCISVIAEAGDSITTQDMVAPSAPQLTNQANAKTLPSDPRMKDSHHFAALGASEAYEIFYSPKTGIQEEIVIAVIDSGIEYHHEDLFENMWVNKGEIPDNGIDDDGNGYVDDVYGYNFASRISSPLPEKTPRNQAWQWAHGTKVAGLAAAVANNSKGAAGLMGTAKIMALNNMGKTATMAQADTTNAIRYAVDNGAHVINLSLGGFNAAGLDYRNALRYAISKGVVVLAAAGNENTEISSSYSAAGVAASLPGLISVGNFQAANFKKSSTSNFSPKYVQYSAPGTYTMRELLFTTTPESKSSYGYFSGTSAATPLVSAAVGLTIGLIKSRGYAYRPAEIETLLFEASVKVPSLRDFFQDGQTLHLGKLARLVDERYPAQRINLAEVSAETLNDQAITDPTSFSPPVTE